MDRFSTFNDMLSSLLERGARLVDWSGDAEAKAGTALKGLGALCADLISSRGEASGVALAAEILNRYDAMDAQARAAFFAMLLERFEPDNEALLKVVDRYTQDPSPETRAALAAAAESPRQELFRRLNYAPDGARRLVRMRSDLLGVMRTHRGLKPLDADLAHLLASWFNRGFLVLRPIDWRTPAHILEKIIEYEAVHEIDSWDELRRRIEPSDRRCFAFFHPAMPDEPLIFVEVALTSEISASVQALLTPERTPIPSNKATTAVFYSISNCQSGLAGVSFGAFLIKQVAADLARDLPNLKTFVTLSPLPGFNRWLKEQAHADPDVEAARALSAIASHDWSTKAQPGDKLGARFMALAAQYLLAAKRPDGQPIDPVARFHLGNGAQLHRINWLADVSANGLAQSASVMVNYLYDLSAVETRHEAYAARRAISAARPVRGLLSSGENVS